MHFLTVSCLQPICGSQIAYINAGGDYLSTVFLRIAHDFTSYGCITKWLAEADLDEFSVNSMLSNENDLH